VPLRCVGDKLVPGSAAALSVRQHVIQLCAERPQATENVVPATVMRQVFLGNSRDYLVTMPNATQLRVVTSPVENVAQGASVWLHLPPDRCRVLSG
jgi:iron(III) transport system ATP-binding protein